MGLPPLAALGLGGAVSIGWLALYFRFHHGAAAFALKKVESEPCAPFDRNEWEAHTAESLEGVNQDMLASLGFVGLMLFSVLEILSGLGQVKDGAAIDLARDDILRFGPTIYTFMILITCALQMAIYLRLRVALGRFSLELDPTDRPFRPFRLTDSFLGYALLAFLLGVSAHLFLTVAFPGLARQAGVLLAIDAAVVGAGLAAEPITLILAGRKVTPSRSR